MAVEGYCNATPGWIPILDEGFRGAQIGERSLGIVSTSGGWILHCLIVQDMLYKGKREWLKKLRPN